MTDDNENKIDSIDDIVNAITGNHVMIIFYFVCLRCGADMTQMDDPTPKPCMFCKSKAVEMYGTEKKTIRISEVR